MSRLDRQEAEARAKAYRKLYENPARYSERMAKIERKYEYKRYKVERNTAHGSGYR
jgi:ribosomal protein S24E